MPVRRGCFITFEGGEGAGKSTQMKHLAERIEALGMDVVTTREPGGTAEAEAIRAYILAGKARALGHVVETLLFAAARADHVERVIRPALARGAAVLCDRFMDSTRAYQGSDGVAPALLDALEALAVGDTRPDLTIIIDVPAAIGLARASERRRAGDADRFEGEAISRHEARRDVFRAIAAREPLRCVIVDGMAGEDDVAAEIWHAVQSRLALPAP